MATTKLIDLSLNRVEGDLEVRVRIDDGVVADAWCSGTMYRGFERILQGRGALDGLVITPRICGICSTSHLIGAALALDQIGVADPPANAVRIRNVVQLAEHIHSDLRHTFLMYTADFVNPRHEDQPLYREAVRRYAPLAGECVRQVIEETKRILEVVAIFGGQWPHSSFVVPGGVASVPTVGDLQHCQLLLARYRRWYERQVLGCTIERWREVKSRADLDLWLNEAAAHRDSELGFFVRFGRAIGLDKLGSGCGAYLSFGAFELPAAVAGRASDGASSLVKAGFVSAGVRQPFQQQLIGESTASSWFNSGDDQPRHPFKGQTTPYATGREGQKYSWAKAPRYDGQPAETGPLAEMIVASDELLTDLEQQLGACAFVRQLARLCRPAHLMPAMATLLCDINSREPCYVPPGKIRAGRGYGLTQAPRGALGHWVTIHDEQIEHYQIITPTTWNCSPRDDDGRLGPVEQALIGTPVRDPDNPVEIGHVVRSFDPCLVCTVHALRQTGGAHSGS